MAASTPTQQQMEPGLAPYASLFGSAAEGIAPEMGNFVAPSTGHRHATYCWAAATETAGRGLIVLVHGFAEHLGRYGHVATYFAKQGFDVCGIDHHIHGLSEGFDSDRGYLKNAGELVTNFSEFVLAEVVPRNGPHYVYCHSTGGLVTLLALDRGLHAKWPKLSAVVYWAPLIRQPSAIAQPLYCCPTVAGCCLSCGLTCGTCCRLPGVLPGQLSSFEPSEAATRRDPLYFGWKANLSIVRALLSGTVSAQQCLDRPTYPFLVMVSPDDKLVDPSACKALFDQAPSSVKFFESATFKGAEHELHNEQDWQKPLETASEWLVSVPAPTVGGTQTQ